jgi:hypothetical protein
LDVDYDLEFAKEEEMGKRRVWGLPVISPTDPAPMGILGGLSTGIWYNAFKARPLFASNLAGGGGAGRFVCCLDLSIFSAI